jgi:dTDP-4-amino-4,6-dideoxygalactose transaminase
MPPVDGMLPELREILESGQLTNGVRVRRLEAAVKAYIGGDAEVICMSSNTTGMMLAWRGMDIEGEVLVPSFTFPATAHVLKWNGLTPVLVDCDRETFNIDVEDARRKITERTVGVAPVYIFGNAPNWTGLQSLMSEHGLRSVSDAAHAFGTTVDGTFAGNLGDVEVFSLAPTKVLTTAEGGFVILRDPDLAEKLRRTRNYGNPGDYDCRELGMNGRMTEVHALLGLHALPNHEQQLVGRDRLVNVYRELLSDVPGLSFQRIDPNVRSTHNYFAVVLEPKAFGLSNRELYAFLKTKNVESKVYFHPPIHKQTLYKGLSDGSDLPNTEWLVDRILCLPVTGHLNETDVATISQFVKEAHANASSVRVRVGS